MKRNSSRATTAPERTRVPLPLSTGLGTGSMLQPLNSSMIAVAVIAIAHDFGTFEGTAWVISGMYIATAVVSPAAGRLGALFGPRRMYLTGLAIIAASSVFGALAPSLTWLIVARALLGVGTATQYPTAMMIVRRVAAEKSAETRTALAVLTVCSQSMVALGPTLGGLLTTVFGWQAIMWVNLPMAALTGLWVLRVAPPDVPREHPGARAVLRRMDLPGTALFLVCITTTMVFLLSLAERPQWAFLPVALVSGGLLVWRELRAPEPFIDVRAMLRNRPLAMTLGRTTVTYTAFYLVYFGLPQWLQGGRGMDAGHAGLIMLPLALVSIASTVTATRVYTDHGPRPALLIGTVGLVVGGALLATVADSTVTIAAIIGIAMILGVPNSFNNIGNQNIVNAVTTTEEVGVALGMYRTLQYIAANIAAVIIEICMGGAIDDAGFHRVGLVMTGLGAALLVGVLCSRTLRGLRPRG
ncbi:MFS transporter [Tomitella gaofuii]|uniref:MFS transporter n=1 Tax=Tomitella gaofuii TaxID=2760083 RepID=UPI0015FDAE2E|nr:MFS transporter [Tomitella gaofuii]